MAQNVSLGTVRRALISTHDKAGLIDLARGLAKLGIEIIASGGTATSLEAADVPLTRVESYTGAKEILGGRVKTLHPKIHAGILADRRDPSHMRELEREGYQPIDLVVCSLYPFAQKLKEGAGRPTLIETIDIGGPSLLRAAAKNAEGGVTVVCDGADYAPVLESLTRDGSVSDEIRRALAAKAFAHTAKYDATVSDWMAAGLGERTGSSLLPERIEGFTRVMDLRYGENPQQRGALYREQGTASGVANGTLLSGKALSYNNLLDMDAAYRAVSLWHSPTCAIVKHTNPCGLAEAATQEAAFAAALAGDPVAAYGSVIAFNTQLTATTAQAIRASKLFVECIAAPGFDEKALGELKARENLRLFVMPPGDPAPRYHAHRIGGGFLVEQTDAHQWDPGAWTCVTTQTVPAPWRAELAFAMQAAAVLKSNAIAITKDRQLLGAGAGQMSRVDAVEQAIKKAGSRVAGSFLGSDAFFPFADSVRLAAQAGVVAVVQPGGSKRDDEVIAACNELRIAMLFTGMRHFRH